MELLKRCPIQLQGLSTLNTSKTFPLLIILYSDKQISEADVFINEFQYSCSFNTQLESTLRSTYEEFDALKVLDLFERIRDDDVPLFDMDIELCRPVDLIITHIPVPPSCIRPSVPVSENTTNEDDLTIKLAEVL